MRRQQRNSISRQAVYQLTLPITYLYNIPILPMPTVMMLAMMSKASAAAILLVRLPAILIGKLRKGELRGTIYDWLRYPSKGTPASPTLQHLIGMYLKMLG